MGVMSRLAAERQEPEEQVYALRGELRTALARFNALVNNTKPGPVRDLYSRWADETREAVENI